MKTTGSKLAGLAYGGDYNPEQWDVAIWREDMRLMKEAGVNFVSVGIFSWAHLEPRPGRYDFGWMDRLLEMLGDNGISVDLATATASPPPWFSFRSGKEFAMDRNGARYFPGGRQHYSPFSREYRRRAVALVEQIAVRYADHPALVLWHVNNEYACHVQECHSPAATRAFRAWLKQKYGTLETLNEAWSTSFWSQRYGAWDEIWTPRRVPAFNNPAQELDYRRCFNDAVLDLYLAERAVLKRHAPNVPVTTNFMWPFKALDYWKWAPHLDLACWDAYPDAHEAPEEFAAFGHDLMRSLCPGRPFLLMEQATTQVNWRPRNALKPPGEMRRLSWQAVGRGSDGVLFFQWRQSRGGAEKFHSAMVPHEGGNCANRVWTEVCELGRELKAASGVVGSQVTAEAAILFDWENWWALELPSKPAALNYAEEVARFHRFLFRHNIAVDFVHPSADLSRYKIVFAPTLYSLSKACASRLCDYVGNGGTCVATYFTGIVDEAERIVLGGYPGYLRKLFGMVVEEWDVMREGETRQITFVGSRRRAKTENWADVVRLETARPLASFDEGFYRGRAAIAENRFGRGRAIYLATRLDRGSFSRLLSGIIAQAGVKSLRRLPPGVEFTQRQKKGATLSFLINHGGKGVRLTHEFLRRLGVARHGSRKASLLEAGGVLRFNSG